MEPVSVAEGVAKATVMCRLTIGVQY